MANEIILPSGQAQLPKPRPVEIVKRSDLKHSILGRIIPQSEQSRLEHGRNLNVDRIHQAMLSANQGYMMPSPTSSKSR